jgi:hypothetical protein
MTKAIWMGVVCAVMALAARSARAETVTTEPYHPIAGDVVTLVVVSPCYCPNYDELTFTRTGNIIDLTTGDLCVSACISDQVGRWNLGALPAGEYTVRRHRAAQPEQLEVIGTFIVAAGPDLPMLSPIAIAALAFALTGLALLALRK